MPFDTRRYDIERVGDPAWFPEFLELLGAVQPRTDLVGTVDYEQQVTKHRASLMQMLAEYGEQCDRVNETSDLHPRTHAWLAVTHILYDLARMDAMPGAGTLAVLKRAAATRDLAERAEILRLFTLGA